MLLVLLAWLGSALSRSSLTTVCSATPNPPPSGLVRHHRAHENVFKDASIPVQLAIAPVRVHLETRAAAWQHDHLHPQFLSPKHQQVAHISAVDTATHSRGKGQQKGVLASQSQHADDAPVASGTHLPHDALNACASKQRQFSPFSFLQETPLPNTVIVIVVGTAILLFLIVAAIVSHYVLSMRSQARRYGYPIQEAYRSPSSSLQTELKRRAKPIFAFLPSY